MNQKELYTLGIDIGSTTVKIAILDENEVLFLIMSVISPTSRKPFQIFWRKLMANLGPFPSSRSSQDPAD